MIDFENISQPPRIGGVKVYDKNISRNEVIMDLDLFYAGDCDINFSLGGMRGGIKDFQIHGTVRIVMKPLISTMPLFGGMQIFFLNNPNIDFNLVGVVDLLDMPGLSDLLRRIIVEQVAAFMVLPNKLPIILSEEIEALSLKMPEPEGVLRVHVVEAKNLMKMDIGMLGKGKSDRKSHKQFKFWLKITISYIGLSVRHHHGRCSAIQNSDYRQQHQSKVGFLV